jgi:membrane-associated protease RseP (regulator of RpoE activity)
MSKKVGYLTNIAVSLFICLASNAPSAAHEGKLKHHSAKDSCKMKSADAWIGVLVQDLSPNRSLAREVEAGALVVGVIEGGPAEAAGVRQGDVIIALNGQPVAGGRQLSDLVAELPAGAEARLTLFSDGKQEDKTITLAEPDFAFKHQQDKPKPRLYPGMFMEQMMSRTPLKQMREETSAGGGRFPPLVPQGMVIKEGGRDYVRLFLRHQEALGLKPEQVKELEHLNYEQKKQEIKAEAEIEIAEIELQELLDEPEIDLTKVEQKIKQLEAARGAKLLFAAKTLHRAQTLLTDEQRAKLKQLKLN